jgi:hypothetical protein
MLVRTSKYAEHDGPNLDLKCVERPRRPWEYCVPYPLGILRKMERFEMQCLQKLAMRDSLA